MFIVTIVGLAGTLLFAVVKARLHLALHVVGLLAVAYVVLVVNYVFPAIDQAASPRKATEEIKVLARGRPGLVHVYPGVAEKRRCPVLPEAGHRRAGAVEC